MKGYCVSCYEYKTINSKGLCKVCKEDMGE